MPFNVILCLVGLGGFTALLQAPVLAQTPVDTLHDQRSSTPSHELPAFWLAPFGLDSQFDEEQLAHLASLIRSPINLNVARRSDLLALPGVSTQQATAILAHRQQHGAFTRISALHEAGLLDLITFKRIAPFLTIQPISKKTQRKRGSLKILQAAGRRFEQDPKYRLSPAEGGYAGSPTLLYSRIAFAGPSIDFRMTLEKDAGEQLFWQPKRRSLGFDHTSGTLSLKGRRRIKEVLLGDFHVLVGEGLMLWRNRGQGKGTQPVTDPVRTGAGFKPAASREENRFLRGIALTAQLTSRMALQLFASRRFLDATLQPATSGTFFHVTALGTSGLHRTTSEQNRKAQLGVSTIGGTLTFHGRLHTTSLSSYTASFEHPFTAGTRPEDLYDFTGNNISGLSISTKIRTRNLYVFAEGATSMPGGYAVLAGARWQLHPRTSIIGVFRNFSPDYHTFLGNAFAHQRARVKNERGWYAGLESQIHRHWTASFYTDVFANPWLVQTAGMPQSGFSGFGKLTFAPRTWLSVLLLYRLQKGQERANGYSDVDFPVRQYVNHVVHSWRFRAAYSFSHMLQLRTQFDSRVSRMPMSRQAGSMLFQDIIWRPNTNWRIQLRLTGFTTPGGAATLYAYEHDLQYRFTIRAFSGAGLRNFLLLRRRVGTHLVFEAKYGTPATDRYRATPPIPSSPQAGVFVKCKPNSFGTSDLPPST